MPVLLFAILLGVVQGLTEFLPVSSSGHLVLFQQVFGHGIMGIEDHVAFDLVLHVGTLLPVVVMYRSDIAAIFRDLSGDGPFMERSGLRLAIWVVVGSVPTGIIGILFKDVFEQPVHHHTHGGVAFGLTAVLLWRTRSLTDRSRSILEMSWHDALIIGLAQGIAITPGISRSGTTIAVALMLGLRRELAARFSFLLSIPAILGAFLLKAKDFDFGSSQALLPLAVGFTAAAVSGWGALVLLLRLVRSGDFSRFAYYLAPLSILAIGYGLFGPGAGSEAIAPLTSPRPQLTRDGHCTGVAQLVEQRIPNPQVRGSSPRARAIFEALVFTRASFCWWVNFLVWICEIRLVPNGNVGIMAGRSEEPWPSIPTSSLRSPASGAAVHAAARQHRPGVPGRARRPPHARGGPRRFGVVDSAAQRRGPRPYLWQRLRVFHLSCLHSVGTGLDQ